MFKTNGVLVNKMLNFEAYRKQKLCDFLLKKIWEDFFLHFCMQELITIFQHFFFLRVLKDLRNPSLTTLLSLWFFDQPGPGEDGNAGIETKARFHVEVSTGSSIWTPKFYIAPYDEINHGHVNLSSNCDVKSGLRVKLGARF